MKPAAVILAERTTDLYSGPGTLLKDSELETGLSTTISALTPYVGKVIVIGDTPVVPNQVSPAQCLSRNLTNVQACAIPLANSNPQWVSHEPAEKAAAAASGAVFIDPVPWMCATSSCSPVVGKYLVMFDWSHITATYGAVHFGADGHRSEALHVVDTSPAELAIARRLN
jgi:hypothetical protein